MVECPDHIGEDNGLAALLEKDDLVAAIPETGEYLGGPVGVVLEFGKDDVANLEGVLDVHILMYNLQLPY